MHRNIRAPDGKAKAPLVPVIIAFGVTSVITQIVILREFLGVFSGNELLIGIVLAAWLFLTGAGAFAGRRAERFDPDPSLTVRILLPLSVIPFVTVLLVRVLRNIIFTPGGMITLGQATLSSLVLLSPYCLLAGFSFAILVRASSRYNEPNPVALVYAWESVGSAVGGILVNVALVTLLDSIQVLLLLMLVNVCLVMVIAYRQQQFVVLSVAVLLACFAVVVGLFGRVESFTRALLFPRQEIVVCRDTPYGNLTVTRQGEQLNVFENSVLYTSTDDVTTDEESVHYAMVQHPSPQEVLVIGGGMTQMTAEILKYGVKRVDCVEINPWLFEIGQLVRRGTQDPRIHVVNEDARRYVDTTGIRYDVVLVNLPDPGTAQINRFYTVDFFEHARRIMKDGGIVATSLLPGSEYQGQEARNLSSVLVSTLRGVFSHVMIVPGQRQYVLASDRMMDIHICRMIRQRGIQTTYVNSYYLDDDLLAERSRVITASLDSTSEVNRDFRPVSYYRMMSYWLSYFGSETLWPLLVLGILIVVVFWRTSIVGVGVFTGGISAMSLEIVLLITFQVFCGSMFQMTGIVITAFMVGLAAGAAVARSVFRRPGLGVFSGIQFAVAGVGIALPQLLLILRGMNPSQAVVQVIFAGVAVLIAVLVGMEFAIASAARSGRAGTVAAELYGMDLVGSAVGALAVSAFAIPLLGMLNTCLAIGAISAIGALISLAAWILKPLHHAAAMVE
jgi:spermidine synthase